jgi:histidyl-tRNA synthetase
VYREQWEKQWKKPVRIFYQVRCFRYERPQAGRYREFTQFGIECLGGKSPQDAEEVIDLLRKCLAPLGIETEFISAAKRGLSYYVEDGFEVECPALGAQKQIAGGGRYNEGIGWAIGVDRTVLAELEQE